MKNLLLLLVLLVKTLGASLPPEAQAQPQPRPSNKLIAKVKFTASAEATIQLVVLDVLVPKTLPRAPNDWRNRLFAAAR